MNIITLEKLGKDGQIEKEMYKLSYDHKVIQIKDRVGGYAYFKHLCRKHAILLLVIAVIACGSLFWQAIQHRKEVTVLLEQIEYYAVLARSRETIRPTTTDINQGRGQR
jgi:hypothetical protein